MALYILKRLFLLIPLLLGITLITFTLTKALPGDPVQGMVGERASPEVIEAIRKQIGSDKSAIEQYAGYLGLLMKGEFGRSYYTGRKVSDDLASKFPNTMRLAFAAMLIAVPVGISLGFLSAWKRGTYLDGLISSASVIGISIPVFWSGLMLMLVVSFYLRLLPPSGTGGLRFLLLPAITLSLPAIATIARVTRTAVMDILDMPFLQTVRAKGVTTKRLALVHVMRNALIPIVTVIGLDFGSYLNGAVLTETIFGWDGIGRMAMEGIIKRDYPVVMGTILIGTAVFVLVNLIVDVSYKYLDPRVRLYAEKG
ncbi:MAG: ABC transporter permease [Thermodesulfovibrionales bacterium]|nr:ABC transporter permease [Thermodesulfovibrionales bacterium]